MALTAGTKLGPYEITGPIGAGGMGEVYRARDSRMGRDIAIKVAAAQFSDRFSREVHTVAAVNHANLCHVYDVGPDYLVMELVEGETLRGPLAFDDALPLILQLIDGIEAAHEKNIVHRDLKPANIKVTPEGVVKILDFGLAKAAAPETESTSEKSPTVTIGASTAGTILGTAAYMSPEQARGKTADKRSDIWSFGVVVYELLTGQQPFHGESVVETLGAVINQEPDWSPVPVRARKLLQWCLEKDRKQRLQAIGDARRMLDEAPEEAAPDRVRSRLSWAGWIAAAAVMVALAVISWMHFRETPPVRQRVRFEIAPPAGTLLDMKLSPDGRFLAFSTTDLGDSHSKLWVRALDGLDTKLLTTVDGNADLFWSPDDDYLGFSSLDKLYKIPRIGGAAITICEAPSSPVMGADWGTDGAILFSSGFEVYRVSSAGATPSKVTDRAIVPMWLTREKFLYISADGIYAGSVKGGQPSRWLPDDSTTAFVPPIRRGLPGYLLFRRGQTLMAQPVDTEKAAPRGEVFAVAENVGRLATAQSMGAFSASANGVLVFGRGQPDQRELVWVDRSGKKLETVSRPFFLMGNPAIRLSPDDTRAIVPVQSGTEPDQWIADLNRKTLSRFTFDGSLSAIWSPDARKVLWAARDGSHYLRSADGSGADELLFKNPNCTSCYPYGWSADGKRIAFTERDGNTGTDIWLVEAEGDRKLYPYLASRFNEYWAQISPDGRWMTYTSDQPGQAEIFVESIPSGKGRWQISTDGGSWSVWRRDGKELFYSQGTRIMAVPIHLTETGVESGKPQFLFDVGEARFQVSRDGQRFLIALPVEGSAMTSPITVDTDWRQGVRSK